MSARFDLTDLRLFLHVADAASITHGAARANMALASASERIRAMEDSLGTRLLERKRRGVSLTPAGSALVHHARIVTQQLEQMRGDLNNYASGLRGKVRVLSNTVAISEFLPSAIAAFLSAHPNIDVELLDRPSHEIARAIADGRADIGIVTDSADPAEQLEIFPLGDIRLVVVAPRRHPLSRRRKIAFRDALDHDFIGLPEGSALQDFLDHQAARSARRLKLRVRLSGFVSMCQMAESGIGLAVVPETAGRRYQRSMAIKVISIADRWALRHHKICVLSYSSLPAHAQRLVRCLNPRPLSR